MLLAVSLSACHSLDDDAQFQKHTKGFILHVQDTSTNAHKLLYLNSENMNISPFSITLDSTVAHIVCLDDELWIPCPNQKCIYIVDLSTRQIKETLNFGKDFFPIDLAQHPDKKEWFFIASENGKIAFYHRKRKKTEVHTYTSSLNHILFANNKLYAASAQSSDATFIVVDVPTRALIKKEPVNSIKQIYRYVLWVRGFSTDSLPELYSFNVNDDILQKSTYTYPLRQAAYSPYGQKFYGKEFIGFVELYHNKLYVNQSLLPHSEPIQGFICDFDESKLIVYSKHKLYYYKDLNSKQTKDSLNIYTNLNIIQGVVHRK
ncbi:MAG: hypothetical protein NZ519_08710 [Bacteroidia bacterium]|nr:hypothetical protein [Bacteroidia bacterium]MDW8302747.1 hypothetical protein [Bacteroidia bacterium]